MTAFAVVDLEATDTAGEANREKKIIQIGIAIVDNWQIVDTFSSLVNPHEPLSENIIQLTGISDKELATTPDFEDLIPEILEHLEDKIFVAHNVKFDFNLLNDQLEKYGHSLEIPKVDTVELARVFFPRSEKYGLEALSHELGLSNAHQHSAIDDALETAELLIKIYQKVNQLPLNVVNELIRHSPAMIYETGLFIEEAAEECESQVDRYDLLGPLAVRKDLNLLEQSDLALATNQSISERRLDKDFAINMEKLGFEVRQSQAEFAALIEESSKNPLPSFIEGQTGIGKSYAYLLKILAQDKNLLVSVPTKILQDQLLNEVKESFQKLFAIESAKLSSSKNYLSLKRLEKNLQSTQDGKNTEIFKMRVLVWLTETRTGELAEISRNVTKQEMFDAVANDKALVEDFWALAERKAKNADLLIVNHAYLAERLKKDPGFIANRVLLVDEAQRLFTVLENAGQEEVSLLHEFMKLPLVASPQKKRELDRLISHLKRISEQSENREKCIAEAELLNLDHLANFMRDDSRFYWLEENTLKSSPDDFYDFHKLAEQANKIYFVSSNIALAKDKPLLPELLGYKEYTFAQTAIKRPDNQQLFAIKDGPQIKKASLVEYSKYMADKILELSFMGIPIISLFTSRQLMEETAGQLELLGVSYGLQQANQHQLLKQQFDAGKFQVLLGIGAFWEGVDFDEQDRLLLVISRLPFATPDDILTKKFAHRYDNPFYDFNLPMAEMRLRQAFGRVNRRPTQKSAVLVLDNRLAGKTYAKRLRKKLSDSIDIHKLDFYEALKASHDFLTDEEDMVNK